MKDLISLLFVLGNRETPAEREWWGDSWFWKQSGQTHLSVICCSLVVKNPLGKAGNIWEMDSVPGLRRAPGEGNGNPLQYSCLENPMDRGAWRAPVHGVAKSRTRLKQQHKHTRVQLVVPQNNYSNSIKDPCYHNKYNNNEKAGNIVRIAKLCTGKWVNECWENDAYELALTQDCHKHAICWKRKKKKHLTIYEAK